jgi:hypothetical protein
LVVWALSGVAAYAGAVAAEALSVHLGLSAATAARFGGGMLLLAGLYQLTPLKDICLSKCRTPISFIMTSWRDGTGGAIRMGLLHGTYCLGCCWLLFAILFPLGIMNMAAMALLTLLVFAEKTLPWGRATARVAAVALMAYGGVVLAAPSALPTYMDMAAAADAPPATSPDYRVELVEVQPAGPGRTRLALRLVHISDNKAVEGAAIVDGKTNMGPGGMPEMAGKVAPLPTDGPSVYRFLIETGMAGRWELVLGAKVQGEPEVVRTAITFNVGF